MDRNADSRKNRWVVLPLVAVVIGSGALAFASVPLYRLFCQVTGFGGTPQIAAAAPETPVDRMMTVRFNADTDPHLPWVFQPVEREIRVRVGEQALAFYRATNKSAEPVVGTAVFNVTPHKAGAYFDKIDCFCFSEQRLEPGESVDMPVTFFIDPEIMKDRKMDGVGTITLSYTFFRTEAEGSRPHAALRTGN